MTLPITTKAITFPKNKFTEKFDEIVVKGEVYRSNTHLDHLNNPEKDKLNIGIKLDKDDYLALKKHRAFGDRKISGIKKVEVKVKELDESGEPLKDVNGKFVFKEDEEGDPVKEFSHYQLSMSIGPYRTVDGVKEERSLDIRAKRGIDFSPTDILAEGTKVIVKGYLIDWTHPEQGEGCTIQPKAIAITELVKLESNYTDPFADMGIDMDDFEEMDVPDFKENKETKDVDQEVGKPADSSTDVPDVPFDDDDPFAMDD